MPCEAAKYTATIHNSLGGTQPSFPVPLDALVGEIVSAKEANQSLIRHLGKKDRAIAIELITLDYAIPRPFEGQSTLVEEVKLFVGHSSRKS